MKELGMKAAAGIAVVVTAIYSRAQLKAMLAPIGPAWFSSPAGPFTIHPWPPMTKLAISGTLSPHLGEATRAHGHAELSCAELLRRKNRLYSIL